MTITFGSPEANQIAKQINLLKHCEEIKCPECDGLKTVIGWDICDCCGNETQRETSCPTCDGEGVVLERADGCIFTLSGIGMDGRRN